MGTNIELKQAVLEERLEKLKIWLGGKVNNNPRSRSIGELIEGKLSILYI